MLQSTHNPLSQAYRLALLDLDGVVYRGKVAVEHAVSSIQQAQAHGMTMEYTTNNSSRRQAVVAEQLCGFGLQVEPWQVITSSVVAARMVARHVPAGANVLVVGAEHLCEEVERQGLRVVHEVNDDPQAVIQGWHPMMTWSDMAQAAYAVERGAVYLVTNRDLTIPREHGIAPGCGSMIQAVMNATGVEPVSSAGKPESAMYDEARLLAARDGAEPVAVQDCLAIGDRLDTDIEAGSRGGYASLVVLTGVADARQLMTAGEALRPTYMAADLRGLLTPHPAVVRDGEAWQCRQARAWVSDGVLQVSDVEHVDGLRAACMAAWDAADHGVSLDVLPQFADTLTEHDGEPVKNQ